MNIFTKYTIVWVCFMICMVSITIGCLISASNRNANYRKKLKTQGCTIETNIRIESPSLIKNIDESTFLQFAKGKIVYNPSRGSTFYVFNNEMTIAYCYNVPIW